MTRLPRPWGAGVVICHGALSLALLATSRPLAAQARPVPVAPGARVRVEAPTLGLRPVVRRVAGRLGDTLLLIPDRRTGGDTLAVALADVVGLEVSRGRLRRSVVAGVVGGIVGTAAAAVYAYNAYDPGPRFCSILCDKMTRRGLVTTWTLAGAQGGLALGALTGRFALGEAWQRLLPPRNRAT